MVCGVGPVFFLGSPVMFSRILEEVGVVVSQCGRCPRNVGLVSFPGSFGDSRLSVCLEMGVVFSWSLEVLCFGSCCRAVGLFLRCQACDGRRVAKS